MTETIIIICCLLYCAFGAVMYGLLDELSSNELPVVLCIITWPFALVLELIRICIDKLINIGQWIGRSIRR